MKHKAFWAEFLGTYALVFFGTGAIIINQVSNGSLGHLGIAAAFGIVVTVMIYSFGSISGAHINPAVSWAFYSVEKGIHSSKQLGVYMFAQLMGGLVASGSLFLLFPNSPTMGQTNPSGTIIQSFLLEIILTFFLMLVILLVSQNQKTKSYTAIAVGAIVFLEALVAGPICGASMNPVRSLAPALFAADLEHLWLYISAPIIGSLLAGRVWKLFNRQ